MHLKNRRVMFLGLLVLAALLLLGVGCKKDASAPSLTEDAGQPVSDASEPVQDSGPVIPEGWRVYTSEEGGYRIAYPPTWKVTEGGALYKDAPDLEQLLAESQGHFTSLAQVAPASIGVVVFDPQGKSVDQLWEEGRDDSEIDTAMIIDGARGRVAKCGGIRYGECVYLVHEGMAYSISVYNVGIVAPPPDAETAALKQEIQQILNTFHFLP
ncbi:MAG: hypothetical protein UX98_C0012G0015 [Parcubacteria group bacterium GW2011_GWA2_47_26]|nr:MAG: hypothetical protein UX98_C0012G0015 [Parcubacteria group bacterium GW2011_GWA2_47_26]